MYIIYTKLIQANLKSRETATIEEYENICKENSCHEVISDTDPVKLYYDFDYDCSLSENRTEECKDNTLEIIDVAKKAIKDILYELYPDKNCPLFAVKIQSSHSYLDYQLKIYKWKISFHLIVTNYCMLKKQQDYFTRKINKYILKEHKDLYKIHELIDYNQKFTFFDISLYHSCSKLRNVYCSKPGENRPSVLVEGTFIDTLVTYIDEKCQLIEYH